MGDFSRLDHLEKDRVEKELFEKLLEMREIKRGEFIESLKELEAEIRALKHIYDLWKLERGLLQVPTGACPSASTGVGGAPSPIGCWEWELYPFERDG